MVSIAFTRGFFGILPLLTVLREGFLGCLDSFVSFKSFDKFDVCWCGGAGWTVLTVLIWEGCEVE